MLHQRVEGFLREENERNAKNVTDTLRTGCPFFMWCAGSAERKDAGKTFCICFGKQEADHDGG